MSFLFQIDAFSLFQNVQTNYFMTFRKISSDDVSAEAIVSKSVCF